MEPLIPPAKRGGNKRTVNLRAVVDGLMYVLSTGCQWRAIPKDLPPRSTVYDYFDLWSWDGTLDRIHDALYARYREAALARGEPDRRNHRQPSLDKLGMRASRALKKGGLAWIRPATMRARKSKGRRGMSLSIRKAC